MRITFWTLSLLPMLICARSAVTYQIAGDRLGGQLIYYCIAKYIAIKHNISFIYKPFEFSDQLKLSTQDVVFSATAFKNYKIIEIGHDLLANIDLQANNLFVVTPKHWQISSNDKAWYGVNSSHQFRQLLTDLIAPKAILKLPILPENAITIAVHVRTGEGYDSSAIIQKLHEKFPKQDFFVKGIERIMSLFPGQKFYIYLFSDAVNPKVIKNLYKEKFVNCPNIIFDCDESSQPTQEKILRDLFFMSKFDCLIRPQSAYSVVAQIIGNHQVIIYPGGELILK